MSESIRGQVALVTGAGRGIGRAVAEMLAREGCHVGLIARTGDQLAETAALCERHGVRTARFPLDVTDAGALEGAIVACASELGGLNILVNNAGVFEAGRVDEADADRLARMVEVNLTASIRATRAALPYMRKAGTGAVLFLASLAGRFTGPGMAGYAASKHGLVGFSGCLFEEVRDQGIKVCTLLPGWTATDMMEGSGVDPSTVIRPEDVAEAVRWVVTFPSNACPTEIHIQPQRTPSRLSEGS